MLLQLFFVLFFNYLENCNGFADPKSDFLLDIDGNGVTTSREHSCILEQRFGTEVGGRAVCWGNDYMGRTKAPLEVDFVQITSGLFFTCGIAVDQTVHCWGQLEGLIPGLYTQIASDSDSRFACGILVDGAINCWGASSKARTVPTINERFIQISCSSQHCCALDQKGYPHCWGEYDQGELYPPRVTFQEFVALIENYGWRNQTYVTPEEGIDDEAVASFTAQNTSTVQFRQISVSDCVSCGITLLGAHIRCWGRESSVGSRWPSVARGPFRQVSVGHLGVCAITASEDDLSSEESILQVKVDDANHSPDSLECWGTVKNFLKKDTFASWDQVKVGSVSACGVSMNSELECAGPVRDRSNRPFLKKLVVA